MAAIIRTSVYIDILPDDAVLKIFGHVDILQRPKLATVSRRWHRLINASYSDIESLSMASTVNFIQSACLEPFHFALHLCGSRLKELRLGLENRFIDAVTIDHIRRFCDPAKLNRLKLDRVTIDIQNMLQLLEHLSGISSLSLHHINNGECDTHLVRAALFHCPHLLNLDLKKVGYMEPHLFSSIRQSLFEFKAENIFMPGTLSLLLQYDLQMEKLDLRLCAVTLDDLVHVCQRAKNLRLLNISQIYFHGDHLQLGVEGGSLLYTAIGSLRELECFYAFQYDFTRYLNDDSIRILSLTNQPPTIEALSIGNSRVTDSGILRLGSFTQLTRLDLSGIDLIHDWSLIQMVGAGVTKLKKFYCCYCKNLTGTFLSTFLSQCPDLILVGVYNCPKIGDDAVRCCIDYFANRTHRFTLCMGETMVTVAAMVSNPQFRGLRINFDWSPCTEHGHYDCRMTGFHT